MPDSPDGPDFPSGIPVGGPSPTAPPGFFDAVSLLAGVASGASGVEPPTPIERASANVVVVQTAAFEEVGFGTMTWTPINGFTRIVPNDATFAWDAPALEADLGYPRTGDGYIVSFSAAAPLDFYAFSDSQETLFSAEGGRRIAGATSIAVKPGLSYSALPGGALPDGPVAAGVATTWEVAGFRPAPFALRIVDHGRCSLEVPAVVGDLDSDGYVNRPYVADPSTGAVYGADNVNGGLLVILANLLDSQAHNIEGATVRRLEIRLQNQWSQHEWTIDLDPADMPEDVANGQYNTDGFVLDFQYSGSEMITYTPLGGGIYAYRDIWARASFQMTVDGDGYAVVLPVEGDVGAESGLPFDKEITVDDLLMRTKSGSLADQMNTLMRQYINIPGLGGMVDTSVPEICRQQVFAVEGRPELGSIELGFRYMIEQVGFAMQLLYGFSVLDGQTWAVGFLRSLDPNRLLVVTDEKALSISTVPTPRT